MDLFITKLNVHLQSVPSRPIGFMLWFSLLICSGLFNWCCHLGDKSPLPNAATLHSSILRSSTTDWQPAWASRPSAAPTSTWSVSSHRMYISWTLSTISSYLWPCPTITFLFDNRKTNFLLCLKIAFWSALS